VGKECSDSAALKYFLILNHYFNLDCGNQSSGFMRSTGQQANSSLVGRFFRRGYFPWRHNFGLAMRWQEEQVAGSS